MKIAIIIVRVLLGALFIFSAAAVLFNLVEQPPLTGAMLKFNDGMIATGYLLKLIKVTELICGIALVVGLFAPLATVVIFPISINIFFVHAFLAPEGMPIAIFVILANLFLAYSYRKHYTSLFLAKPLY